MLAQCPYCERQIPADSRFCPYCEKKLESPPALTDHPSPGDDRNVNRKEKPMAQPPSEQQRIQQVLPRIKQMLTQGEEIVHIVMRSDPLNPVANLSPDCVVLTNKRFFVYKTKLLGGANFKDFIWRELSDAHLKEGMTRATISFKTTKGQIIHVENLPKDGARKMYTFAQEMEEKVREERRQRQMEEKRAAAGGVIISGAPQVAPAPAQAPAAPPQEDPMQKLTQLKTMLEADLITQEEYDAKKAEILAAM